MVKSSHPLRKNDQPPLKTLLPDVDIMYTGKLLGYFRTPSLQSREMRGCPDTYPSSDAAVEFFKLRKMNSNAILVGTGDNFAPQLEARIFGIPTPDPSPSPKKNQTPSYQIENKELYYGDDGEWVRYTNLTDSLEKRLEAGRGTIPSEMSLFSFLRFADFRAILPGKHDFYFGAERVRQYARLLADDKLSGKPVQMLGANLVIKTVPIESVTIPDFAKKSRTFEDWLTNISLLNLTDGKTVYPWLSQ